MRTKVRSDDLILIAPEWQAASFNWYFKEPTEEIAYPHERRVEAMQYDHLLDLYRSPMRFNRIKERLEDARRDRRRIWFITGATFSPNPGVVVSENIDAKDWFEAGLVRADQMYALLESYYGMPVSSAESIPPDSRPGSELRAFLFVPESSASGDAGLQP
jgi:hypothetical protein